MTAIAALSGETDTLIVENVPQDVSCRVQTDSGINSAKTFLVLNYQADSGDVVKATFDVQRSVTDDLSPLLTGTGNKSYRVTVEEVV